MRQPLNEQFRRMQKLAGIIKESIEEKISFGPFTNVTYYTYHDKDIQLVVDESNNFQQIEAELINTTSDSYSDKEISILNDKLEELAKQMSDYLTQQGINNEIFDSPIGYGQEIDRLVIEISKEDFNKLKQQ